MRNKVKYFDSGSVLSTFSTEDGIEADNGTSIVKSALLMVEGEHTDSAKRKHVFDAERIRRIVANTNALLEKAGRIPWQKDHLKTQDANIGDLEGTIEVRVITPEDLPNPKATHLVGRVGAFTSALVGKGKDVVEAIKAGKIKTLSPGIDIVADVIREITATPTPAIEGLSTFKQAGGSMALSFDQAEQSNARMEEIEEKYEETSETLWEILCNISCSSPEDLMGESPEDLVNKAMEDFKTRVMTLVESMASQSYSPDDWTQEIPSSPVKGALDPKYINRQQDQSMYNKKTKLSAFTMSDLEPDVQEQIAQFGFRKAISGTLRELGNRQNTGKSTGDILKRGASKLGNAARGKVAGVGRKLSAIGKKVKTMLGKETAPAAAGLSGTQKIKNAVAKAGFGTKSTNPGSQVGKPGGPGPSMKYRPPAAYDKPAGPATPGQAMRQAKSNAKAKARAERKGQKATAKSQKAADKMNSL